MLDLVDVVVDLRGDLDVLLAFMTCFDDGALGWYAEPAGPICAAVDAVTYRFARLRRIGIDEISYTRGHKYLTVVVAHDCGLLVWTRQDGPGAGRAGSGARPDSPAPPSAQWPSAVWTILTITRTTATAR